MKYLPLIWANVCRNKSRTLLTLLSISTAFLLFGLLDGVRGGIAYAAQSESAAKRLQTGSRLSFMQTLPLALHERIAEVSGVEAVTYASWFGATYQSPRNPILSLAVAPNYLDLYPEIAVDPWSRESFSQERSGVLVGEGLMRRFSWRVGQKIPLESTVFPYRDGGARWDFTIVGTLRSQSGSGVWFDNILLMQWSYFDESTPFNEGGVGWYVVEADDVSSLDQVTSAIDAISMNSAHETKTRTEAAAVASRVNQMADIGLISRSVMGAVFFTLLFVAGNSAAQSLRERIAEIAILRTIGFTRSTVFSLVMTESVSLSLTGGLVGLALSSAFPLLISTLTMNMVEIPFPGWRSVYVGVGFMLGTGVLAGLRPAVLAIRMDIPSTLNSR
ncbi:MAG: ABC transporter permease [Gammaproteobacteria bacterium]|nr:ABC transporter permease [Gammaproteobacteria bacterium]